MIKVIEVKTIEEWRKTLSILFDMGYSWYSWYRLDQRYFKYIHLVDNDNKKMYCSTENEGMLYELVSELTEDGIRYKIIEKHHKKKWKICTAIYNINKIVTFSACDVETNEVIALLYAIHYYDENRIEKAMNIPSYLYRKGYSLMGYRFDSDGCIILK